MHLFKANDKLSKVTWKSLSIQMSFVPLGQHAFQKQKNTKKGGQSCCTLGCPPVTVSTRIMIFHDISSRGSRTKTSFTTVSWDGGQPKLQ